MSRAFWKVSSRVIDACPSGLPNEKASPALVVANASKPKFSNTRAEPASHGLGATNIPWRWCNALNFSARACKSSEVIGVDFIVVNVDETTKLGIHNER